MKRLLPLFCILVILSRRPEWHPPTSHSLVIFRPPATRLTSSRYPLAHLVTCGVCIPRAKQLRQVLHQGTGRAGSRQRRAVHRHLWGYLFVVCGLVGSPCGGRATSSDHSRSMSGVSSIFQQLRRQPWPPSDHDIGWRGEDALQRQRLSCGGQWQLHLPQGERRLQNLKGEGAYAGIGAFVFKVDYTSCGGKGQPECPANRCAVFGDDLKIQNDKTKWRIANEGQKTITLNSLFVYWPAGTAPWKM